MSQKHGGKPIPFIEHNDKKGFLISEKAIEFLQKLEGKKIGVVSVVGKYRTGKSYLLNKVLLNIPIGKKGFEVGPTINACTRGIWIWSETVKSMNPNEQDLEIIIMDTEGFGGVNEGHNHDTRIFLFSILLSSFFVYNSVGSIDENALQALSLIVNLAKEVQKSEKGYPGTNNQELTDEEIRDNFPYFLWILRDFSLKLIDENKNTINSNEYLENALNPVKGSTDAIEGKNKIRRLLKHFFARRECTTLIRPVEKESQLQNLEELTDDDLRLDFLNQADKLRKLILSKTFPKTFNKSNLDGPQLLQLARAYVDSINSGKAPSLDYAWNYVKNFENQKIFNQLFDEFKNEGIPVRTHSDMLEIKRQLIDIFNERKMGDDDENADLLEEFEEEMDRQLLSIYDKHKKSVKLAILNKVNDDFDVIKEEILKHEDLSISMCEEILHKEQEQIKYHFRNELEQEEIEKIVDKNFTLKKTEILGLAAKKIHQRKDKIVKDIEIKNLQELNAISQTKNSLQKRVQEKEEEIAAERSKNFKLKLENEKLIQNIDELNMEVDALRDKLESYENDFESKFKTDDEIEKVKLELITVQTDMSNVINEKNREIALLNQKLGILENENRNLKTVNQKQEDIVLDTQEKLTELEIKYKEAIKTSKNNVNLSDNQIIVERSHLNRLNEKIEANEDLLNNYEKIVNQLNSEKEVMEKHYEVLKYTIENAVMAKDNFMNDIGDKIDEIKNNTEFIMGKSNKETENNNKVIKYASIVQCAKCNKFFSTIIFIKHINGCLQGENNVSAFSDENLNELPYKDSLTITVEQSVVTEESKKSLKNNNNKSNYVTFILKIEGKNRTWRVSRRFIDFYQLISDIKDMISGFRMPVNCYKLIETVEDIWSLVGNKGMISEDRKQLLQTVIDELVSNKQIRNHILFRKFIEELTTDEGYIDNERRNYKVAEDKYYLQQLSRESL